MSLEQFSKAIYQDLPSQNLGFVEGGVLICPSMVGLSLPTDMQDRDLYIYLCLYSKLMDKLALAADEEQGKLIIEDASRELEVPKDQFEKDTGKIFMLECLIAKKILPTSFDQIQMIFKNQKHRSEQILKDLSQNVDVTAKEIGEKLKNKVALKTNNVKESMEVESAHQPPDTLPTQLPSLSVNDYSGVNQFALGSTEESPNEEDKGFLATAKDFAMKPPVLIGGVVASYFLLNKFVFSKKSEEPTRKQNKRRSKKRSKNEWRS